jgi:hypothetical protein
MQNNMTLSSFKDLAQATSIKLNLNQYAVEKDFHITNVIRTLTLVDNAHFALVFQGGTSLSKGYQVIRRLSEDVDFRIVPKHSANKLGKESLRNCLRDYRYAMVKALREAQFKIADEAIKVFYEGRFMSIDVEFDDNQQISYLKPHIAIECFLNELALEPQISQITSLIKLTMKEECHHIPFPVNCVALDETAAEKWVALTRRVSGTKIKSRQSDKHLVRHLYDLYKLNTSGVLSGDYRYIIGRIIDKDRLQYLKHDPSYAEDPVQASELALESLLKDNQWREHWDIFIKEMVYDDNKPSFDVAYNELLLLSKEIIGSIRG